jgi:adenosylmethionine-8-amino-7-oxononanoate aminotransferase
VSTSGTRSRTSDLVARDLRSLWHPFTQHAAWPDDRPVVVDRAEGVWLVDTDGNRYLDGVSSLWVTVHGHGEPGSPTSPASGWPRSCWRARRAG